MRYDDWLVYMEHNHRGWDAEFECPQCGAPTESDDYCSTTCFKASWI